MQLYIYEHCRFCVRPRLVSDIKKLNLSYKILAYDDQDTPHQLVSKKILPILQKNQTEKMLESLDICDFLNIYDGNPIMEPSENNNTINQIFSDLESRYKYLTHPRQIFHPLNHKDFPNLSAKNYFRNKMENKMGISFEEAIINSKNYAIKVQPLLEQLDRLLNKKFISSDKFSLDDVLYFPILRELTLASDILTFSQNISYYMQRIYSLTNIKPYIPMVY